MQQRLVIVLVGMLPCPMSPLWFDRIFFATRYLSRVGGVKGKTYCFGSEAAKAEFMKDPEGNLAKAQTYYSKKHAG